MMPRWPICIPSKGRAGSRITMRMFDRMQVPYTVFVEPQEAEAYQAVIPAPATVHVMPHRDRGLTFTRNYIWDEMARQGHERYWTFDDNIGNLYRFNRNIRIPCADATVMAAIEAFASRYQNLPMCGMNYLMFAPDRNYAQPFRLNTRIYSNMLIQTDARSRAGQPWRFVTYFNDDTDICLRLLKDGWVTVLFNAFLVRKITTMVVKGGNTEIYKATDRRRQFVEELIQAHPDRVTMQERWGRNHHLVDYSGFTQRLIRKPGLVIPEGVNNFGMVLEEQGPDGIWRGVEGSSCPAAAPVLELEELEALADADDAHDEPTPCPAEGRLF